MPFDLAACVTLEVAKLSCQNSCSVRIPEQCCVDVESMVMTKDAQTKCGVLRTMWFWSRSISSAAETSSQPDWKPILEPSSVAALDKAYETAMQTSQTQSVSIVDPRNSLRWLL